MAIKEITRNKKYQIEVVIGYNGTKKIRHYETFYGKKSDAQIRESELKAQIKNNTYIRKNKLTVKDLMNEFLDYNESKWSPVTFVTNKHWINNINNKIGHIHLQDLNVKILEDFYNYLRNETNYSDKTIQHHYTLINSALNKAILWNYLQVNPNSKIEKPKVRKKEISCYSPEEVEKLITALQSESLKYQSIILLALDTGARRGEITGLTWEDVDFKNGIININKSTQYVSSIGIFEKETKTPTSDRKIYISKTTLDILKEFKKKQEERQLLLGNKWGNSKRIFTTDDGFDMHPDTPSSILERIIKKHNLRRISFHALRHTSISLMISKGIQTQVISKKAGHSSIQVTHSTYSHFFDNEFKEAANLMEEFLTVKSD